MAESNFKLTYATMFDPPEELHTRYEDALEKIKSNLGQEHSMIIGGEQRFSDEKFEDRNPANTDEVLGIFQRGSAQDAENAISTAQKAFSAWSRMKWQDRVALIRKAADLIDERVFEISAVISLEVGKNRIEALADAAETADLIRYACFQMEQNDGFIVEMGKDPLVGYTATNYSKLKPYGVWVVISPFNFPAALTGGPAGAALVAGNTIVMKPATYTPWTARLLTECFLDAGIPDGVVNYVTGPGGTVGQTLIDSNDIDGITFTGSYDVGMKIYRTFANGIYPRPLILEMGGKNPAIVSRNADVERASLGIVRAAFGLQGQKCSACSRALIEEPLYDDVVNRVVELTEKLSIGDPTKRTVFNGPVISENSYKDYMNYTEDLDQSGNILIGGKVLTEGEFAKGYFCENTVVADVPMDHRLWKHEMFVPITMVHKVQDLEEAMTLANDVQYGLTSGFYGTQEEGQWYFENIEAGVNYVNRPHGATTGAWPGFQPFGGWKGSGSSGKNAGGHYYLQLYMHEQIQTLIE
ncbi:MAG: aldehyde dehydrogenase family protein [Anaerolineales bacterium]|jgi:1-pyrroline-5-carboxylate dehydrogenase